MKNFFATLVLIFTSASGAMAGNGQEPSGFGLLTMIFFGFVAMILAAQLLPGLLLFITGTKSIFGKRASHR